MLRVLAFTCLLLLRWRDTSLLGPFQSVPHPPDPTDRKTYNPLEAFIVCVQVGFGQRPDCSSVLRAMHDFVEYNGMLPEFLMVDGLRLLSHRYAICMFPQMFSAPLLAAK